MTAYHAIHESPYSDECPDCTGFGDDYRAESREASRRALPWLLAFAVIVLVAAYCFGRGAA